MASSGRPICVDRMRRLKNGTLAAPETVSLPLAASHSRHDAARLQRQPVVAAGAQPLAADVGRVGEGRVGVALARVETPASGWCPAPSNSRLWFFAAAVPVGHRRQRLDLDRDRFQRVLADGDAVGQHHGDRLADIAHLVVRDHRLLERLELRQRLQPHRDDRRAARHVGRGDDRMHAGHLQRRRGVDRDDAAVRHRAAQDHGIEQASGREIVDILAAAAQEAQILAPLHRACR